MPELFGIDLKSSTFEVLLKYGKNCIEATAGTWMLPWQAGQQAKTLRSLSAGQSDAINTLLTTTPDSDLNIEISSEIKGHTITTQGKKRINNLSNVLQKTAQELEDSEAQHHDPDLDFAARFFGEVQDVSSEQLQSLWAKILANEVRKPGRTSLRTLEALRNMTVEDARLFEHAKGFCLGVSASNHFIFRDDSIMKSSTNPAGLDYLHLTNLQEFGLLSQQLTARITLTWFASQEAPYTYQHGVLLVKRNERSIKSLEIPAIRFTTVGNELARVVSGTFQEEYLQMFSTFLHKNNHSLEFAENATLLKGGHIEYNNRRPIQPNI